MIDKQFDKETFKKSVKKTTLSFFTAVKRLKKLLRSRFSRLYATL